MTLDLNKIRHFQNFYNVGIISALDGTKTTDMGHVIIHSLYILVTVLCHRHAKSIPSYRKPGIAASSYRKPETARLSSYRKPKNRLFLMNRFTVSSKITVGNNLKIRLLAQFIVAFHYNAKMQLVSSKKSDEKSFRRIFARSRKAIRDYSFPDNH